MRAVIGQCQTCCAAEVHILHSGASKGNRIESSRKVAGYAADHRTAATVRHSYGCIDSAALRSCAQDIQLHIKSKDCILETTTGCKEVCEEHTSLQKVVLHMQM